MVNKYIILRVGSISQSRATTNPVVYLRFSLKLNIPFKPQNKRHPAEFTCHVFVSSEWNVFPSPLIVLNIFIYVCDNLIDMKIQISCVWPNRPVK